MADAREGWLSSIVSTTFLIFAHSSKRSATPFFVGFGSCSSCGRNHLRKSTQRNLVVTETQWPPPMCSWYFTSWAPSSSFRMLASMSSNIRRKDAHLHTNTNNYTRQIFRRLSDIFYRYCNTNIRITNIKVDIRKIVHSTTTKQQNTIKIGIFKQFTFALWQTETGMKFPSRVCPGLVFNLLKSWRSRNTPT